MRATDLAAVSAISDAVHGRFTEPLAVYAGRLDLYPAGCFVLEQDDTVAGYLISHPWHREDPPKLGALPGAIPPDADAWYLHDLALLPAARGAGAGRAALDLVKAQARARGFADIALMAVGGADRYWTRQGFAYVPRDADPSYGDDAYLMLGAI
ncbi:GNAT family N-acetyltransferase [Sphingomonas sp. DG1-23]|uniref:GNAT family N-acetyltransferase n=1 Tax=Sphingomonas sp. DG1-23 TaxID=3068316 RepID=UPI00273FA144|nr:GNAT family N-acetyltransferase [Sphingomonas sp. DG1-23]MDP5279395.1 GNAT family N-acetyltransferase [Sphingomonas sp. DG1-23]